MDEAIVRLRAEKIEASKEIVTDYATARISVKASHEGRPIATLREALVLTERVLSEPRLDEAIEIAPQMLRVSLSRERAAVAKATNVYEEVALRVDTVRRVECVEGDLLREELVVREPLR